MTPQEEEEIRAQLQHLKGGIREIAHDISNPLGVLRMAAYYLQHGTPDKEKQEHYYTVIGQTVEKVEGILNKLRALSEPPKAPVHTSPPPDPSHKEPQR